MSRVPKRINAHAIPERLPPRIIKTSSTWPYFSKTCKRNSLGVRVSRPLVAQRGGRVKVKHRRAGGNADSWWLGSDATCLRSSSELPGGQPKFERAGQKNSELVGKPFDGSPYLRQIIYSLRWVRSQRPWECHLCLPDERRAQDPRCGA